MKSTEEMCRELLAVAIRDGLVKEGECPPENLSSGDLVGMANLLSEMVLGGGDVVSEPKPLTATFTIGTPIIPPSGACIRIVKVWKLCLDREWQEAVSAAGPDTDSDRSVRKVGGLYLPTGTGVVEEEEHVLLNYPNGGGDFDSALMWAAQFKLTPNDPRRVFAMAEQNPNLHRDIGMNPMRVVAPMACTFDGSRRACCVWWDDAERGVNLDWITRFDEACGWFSFRLPAQAGK